MLTHQLIQQNWDPGWYLESQPFSESDSGLLFLWTYGGAYGWPQDALDYVGMLRTVGTYVLAVLLIR